MIIRLTQLGILAIHEPKSFAGFCRWRRPWSEPHSRFTLLFAGFALWVLPEAEIVRDRYRFAAYARGSMSTLDELCIIADYGDRRLYLMARIPRVECPQPGKLCVWVPWNGPHSRFNCDLSAHELVLKLRE